MAIFRRWRLAMWIGLCQFVAVLPAADADRRAGSRDVCQRDPPDIDVDSTAGDHGYRIQILGNAAKYTPGQVYTVAINGPDPSREMIGFMLVAVPVNARDETTAMGTFQHMDPRATRFVPHCPHVIADANRLPRRNIELLWTAPSSGAGCVEFRATVVERSDLWFRDDGALTKVFCQDTRTTEGERPPELLPDCCACGTAKYQLTFQGHWSERSHPKDYPTHRRLLHWSNIVGASHSRNYMVWQYGEYATRGVKEVCELGYPRTVEEEIQQNSRHVRSLIKTTGIWWAEPHGIDQSRTARFSTDRRRHLMSLLTMLGPSPDWCVGVSAIDMCLPNCTWAGDMTISLYPWDAGTDDGVSYMSPNAKSDPQKKIRRITNIDEPRSPFYGPDPIRPVATLTIRRLNPGINEVPAASGAQCTDNADEEFVDSDSGGSDAGLADPTDNKCAITPWMDWSSCSVTCGVGQRVRKRNYINQMVDESMCGIPVMEVENCIGIENECETVDEDCAVTQWSSWSPCSATCEKGTRQRLRYYLNKEDMARCDRTTEELDMCMAEIFDCDKARAMLQAASTCTLPASVGPCRGDFTRWYYDSASQRCLTFSYGGCRGNNNRFETLESCEQTCGGSSGSLAVPSTTTPASLPSFCSLPSDSGPCRGSFPGWYFDTVMHKCLPFTYGGCRGNANRFSTEEQCQDRCLIGRGPSDADSSIRVASTAQPPSHQSSAVCLLPLEVGPCRNRISSWYYDTVMQKCLPFTFGGCQGNANRFATEEQCTNLCVREPFQSVTSAPRRTHVSAACSQPMVIGPCHAHIPSWYFDNTLGQCRTFNYGGCGGNANRFSTEEYCTEMCGGQPAVQPSTAQSGICSQPMVPGTCRANIASWYFDTIMQKCLPFTYSGCGGNANRFATEEQCVDICILQHSAPVTAQPPAARFTDFGIRTTTEAPPSGNTGNIHRPLRPVHCSISPWSSWSGCTCGTDRPWQVRHRQIRREAANGGRRCPTHLEQRKRCDPLPQCSTSRCVLSEWSEWTECSKTCGNDAVQQREKHMVPVGANITCVDSIRLLRRICTQLPPCPQNQQHSSDTSRHRIRRL